MKKQIWLLGIFICLGFTTITTSAWLLASDDDCPSLADGGPGCFSDDYVIVPDEEEDEEEPPSSIPPKPLPPEEITKLSPVTPQEPPPVEETKSLEPPPEATPPAVPQEPPPVEEETPPPVVEPPIEVPVVAENPTPPVVELPPATPPILSPVAPVYADFWVHANPQETSFFNLKGVNHPKVTLYPSPNGVLYQEGNRLVYTPKKNFRGVDTFSYALEANGSSSIYLVKVKVAEDYQGDNVWDFEHEQRDTSIAPLMVNFRNGQADYVAIANANRPSIFKIANADHLRSLSLFPSSNSQLFDNQDGSITYLAKPGFQGIDTFLYRWSDTEGNTFTYTVSVKITPDYLGYDYWDFTSAASKTGIGQAHFYGSNNYGFWQPGDVCETIYIVNDQGVNDSQLLSVDTLQRNVVALGALHRGYDLESLEVSPENHLLYAVSGDNAVKKKGGWLYVVDTSSGDLTPIGNTGFKGVVALAFRYDGTLWGWAEGKGIIQINPQTGRSFLKVPFHFRDAEGLAWTTKGDYLYASEGSNLWWWKYGDSSSLSLKCKNLPGQVEALETLPGGMLMFALDHGASHQLYVYDPWHCSIFEERSLVTNYSDIEGIAWTTKCQPAPLPLPKIEGWTGSFSKKDQLSCFEKPKRMKVSGEVNLFPPDSQAIFQSNWQIISANLEICQRLKPPYETDCRKSHEYSEIIAGSFKFEIQGEWPGNEVDAATWFEVNILDLQGRPLSDYTPMTKLIKWSNGQCTQTKD